MSAGAGAAVGRWPDHAERVRSDGDDVQRHSHGSSVTGRADDDRLAHARRGRGGSGSPSTSASAGRCRRAVPRHPGTRPGLPSAPRADRVPVRRRPVRSQRLPDVPHRRRGALDGGRNARVPGQGGRPDQDPRFPCRAGRDQCRAEHASGRRVRRDGGATEFGRRSDPGVLHHGRRGRVHRSRGVEGAPGTIPARLHGSEIDHARELDPVDADGEARPGGAPAAGVRLGFGASS